MITGLAQVCFVVKSLDASIAFYSDALGMTQAFEFINEQGKRFGIYLHAGRRNFIELFEGTPEPADGKPSFQHICLEVDDIEQTVATLKARGVDVSPITLGSDHSWQAWLTDPYGNRIELHGYTAESKQASWVRG